MAKNETEETTAIVSPSETNEATETPDDVAAPSTTQLDEPGTPAITPLGDTMPESTEPKIGLGFEKGLDIKIGTTFQEVRFIMSAPESPQVKEADGSTRDDFGADHPVVLANSMNIDLTVRDYRKSDGKYMEEVEEMMEAARSTGDDSKRTFRVYDKPEGDKTPNPTDAYEFDANVSLSGRGEGLQETGTKTFSLKGVGPIRWIANPQTTP